MSRSRKQKLVVSGSLALALGTLLFSCFRHTIPRTSQDRFTVLEGHRFPVQALAFGPDGSSLTSAAFSATENGSALELSTWDGGIGKRTPPPTSTLRDLVWLCFAPGGQRFAAIGKDWGVWLGDTTSARRLGDHPSHVFGLAFSAEAGLLALADAANVVTIWDVVGGRPTTRVIRGAEPVVVLAFAPGGRVLAGGCTDHTVRLWDVATREERTLLQGHTHMVWAVAFSPDGRLLASGDTDGVVKVWDVATEEELVSREASADAVCRNQLSALAFSPDGRTLAVAVDHTVQLWDVATGRLVARLKGHEGKVKCLAFAPDGSRLASGSFDRTVRLWDVAQHRTGVP
jgi:hypothetical protein